MTSRYDAEYTRYQSERGMVRRLVRHVYLRNTLRWVKGKTLDFGCGIGELLALLPHGSVGYEVNAASVRFCRERGLDVRLYRPEEDRYEFRDCRPGEFATFIMAHVLEHLEGAQDVLRRIAKACARLGIERMIIIVPGRKGFLHDPTHATFVDRGFLDRHGLAVLEGYHIIREAYFPIPWSWGGRVFTHHEMAVVYDR